ncbi:hypothetical protein DMW20_11920 [Vibrio parahaemolyticus]|nr:hypothetical protein [Vibrio parahaemolyticus]
MVVNAFDCFLDFKLVYRSAPSEPENAQKKGSNLQTLEMTLNFELLNLLGNNPQFSFCAAQLFEAELLTLSALFLVSAFHATAS